MNAIHVPLQIKFHRKWLFAQIAIESADHSFRMKSRHAVFHGPVSFEYIFAVPSTFDRKLFNRFALDSLRGFGSGFIGIRCDGSVPNGEVFNGRFTCQVIDRSLTDGMIAIVESIRALFWWLVGNAGRLVLNIPFFVLLDNSIRPPIIWTITCIFWNHRWKIAVIVFISLSSNFTPDRGKIISSCVWSVQSIANTHVSKSFASFSDSSSINELYVTGGLIYEHSIPRAFNERS